MARGRITLPMTHREREVLLALLASEAATSRTIRSEVCINLGRRISSLTIPDDETGELVAPTGARIVSLLERVEGTARIIGTVLRRADGSLDYEHADAPDLAWDTIEPVLVDGEAQFVDADGAIWSEGDLVPAADLTKTGDGA